MLVIVTNMAIVAQHVRSCVGFSGAFGFLLPKGANGVSLYASTLTSWRPLVRVQLGPVSTGNIYVSIDWEPLQWKNPQLWTA